MDQEKRPPTSEISEDLKAAIRKYYPEVDTSRPNPEKLLQAVEQAYRDSGETIFNPFNPADVLVRSMVLAEVFDKTDPKK